MNKNNLCFFAFVVMTVHCLSQPYVGTIFIDEHIVSPSDSSVFVNATYTGQDLKTVFDRRVDDWVTINAFLFDVEWNDGLTSEAVVNPEFGTSALAEIMAEKYGRIIGQLPHCLRTDVHEIWIHQGKEDFGGGNNSILIHTTQADLYEAEGILEETLLHEACHTSLDATHAESADWLIAQSLDEVFISDYAKDNPKREDIAESFLAWIAVRHRADRISAQDFNAIIKAIPNRLIYFDEIVCDLFPLKVENVLSLNESNEELTDVVFYPNPAADVVQLKLEDEDFIGIIIYNSIGEIVIKSNYRNIQELNLSHLVSGVYYFSLNKEDGSQIIKKLIKK